ncbi:CASP8-associated protein 2 [Syngnathus typhle]
MERTSNDMALVAVVNEDSVDIYDDLDLNHSRSLEKIPPNPSQLKDSMDLYEEIVTEEQQDRESSYTELKSRFEAAQQQIKELHRRLQNMEIQNTKLNTENTHLKKNISALLRTARQEVLRKDAEIQRLNQSSNKGQDHHSRVNHLQDQNSSSKTVYNSTRTPKSPTPSLCPSSRTSSSSSRDSGLPKVPLQPPRRESHSPNNKASSSSSYSRSKRGHDLVPDRHNEHSTSNSLVSSTRHHEHKDKPCQKPFDATDRKHRSSSSPKRGRYTTEKDRTHKLDKDSGRRTDSRICKSSDNKNVDGYHRSDRSRSPPINNLGSSDAYRGRSGERRHKIDCQQDADTDDSRRHHKKMETSLKCGNSQIEHSNSNDRRRSSANRQAESYSEFSKEMKRDRLSKDYHWKGDNRHRSFSSERSRQAENPPSKESHNVKRNKERQEKHVKTLAMEPVEGKTQNRKLSFMETLNLTISPIKKPVPNNTSQDRLTVFENMPDDGVQAAGDQNVSNEFKGLKTLPPNSIDAATSEKLPVKAIQEKHTSHNDSCLAIQKLEGTCVQAIKSNQFIDSEANFMATHHIPERNTSLIEKKGNNEAKAKFSPDTQLQDETSHDSNTFGNIMINQPISPLRKLTSGSHRNQCVAIAQCPTSFESFQRPGAPKDRFVPEEKIKTNPGSKTYPIPLSQDSQPGATSEDAHCAQDDFRDAVSSTISAESVPQEELSLREAVNLKKDNSTSVDSSSSIGCIAVSKVSSTTEEIALPNDYRDLTVTPKKKLRAKNVSPSTPVQLFHDEDSMIRTLCHLKRIPDAISPLRSPIHLMKTSRHLLHGKPGHVKSLQKEFSTTVDDPNSKKLDLNKENKYPGCPVKHDKQDSDDKLSELPLNQSDTEVEEGEISSGSEEMKSSLNATTRLKMAEKLRNQENLLKRNSEETCVASKEKTTTESASTQSPANKSRFKTVCPSVVKTSFSTIEEVMEMFTSVRLEIRKKYMKLHKSFPKKSFFGVMENFRESFVEFVDSAHFGQICCQATELKSKLKLLIVSVFNKVADNGIVKRIFDQQAVDLKQKLWVFVDNEVEFLLKEVYVTLKNLCRPAKVSPEEKTSRSTEGLLGSPHEKIQQDCNRKDTLSSLKQIKPFAAPHKTGLGSRGKDIRLTPTVKEGFANTSNSLNPGTDHLSPPKKSASDQMTSLVASQSTSILDKSDFELLTEQQTTSLTFNLVRDSQMGEIFKCLLQGSDLLETTGIPGESTSSWTLSTPKKNGDLLACVTTPNKFQSPSKLIPPTKFDTPTKLIATWTSISPRSKDMTRTNPVLFDESCLLEVPSENQSSFLSQRNYSILAEDLAVSLTIPSPLKSDSHLSFLQPSSIHTISPPDSVISAHISEDALLDGEDASEQDIHLALDTDNSSLGSSNSATSQIIDNTFVLKPELPMQALVMEKSNDHFVVKIRQGNILTDLTQTEENNNREEIQGKHKKIQKDDHSCNAKYSFADLSEDHLICQDTSSFKDDSLRLKKDPSATSKDDAKNDNLVASQNATLKMTTSEETLLESCEQKSNVHGNKENPNLSVQMEKHSQNPPCPAETIISDSQKSTGQEVSKVRVTEKDNKDCEKSKKRKKQHEQSKAKRSRKDEENDTEDFNSKNDVESNSVPSSPNSLSAMNMIKKKGALVIAWTRDEDRAILVDLKTKGASRKTFAALSDQLKKPSEQIAQRFYQLMKLFKKQGNTNV